MDVCAPAETQRKIEIEAELRQRESVWRLIKRSLCMCCA